MGKSGTEVGNQITIAYKPLDVWVSKYAKN
jgi:hypothetical protein